VVFGELGVERNLHQPTLAGVVHFGRDVQERHEFLARFRYAYHTWLIVHEEPTIRREFHVRAIINVSDDCRQRETRRKLDGSLGWLHQRQQANG
jgi:hypothetical protein